MSQVGLELAGVVSLPDVPAGVPQGSYPGYDVWPGGDAVFAGGAWYSDGIYAAGSTPALALKTASETSYALIGAGLQAVTVYGGVGTRGVHGPMPRLRPLDRNTDLVTVTVYASWESGAFTEYDLGDGTVSVSPSFVALIGAADDPSGGAFYATLTTYPLGDRHYRMVYDWYGSDWWRNAVSLPAMENPEDQRSIWRVWHVTADIPILAVGAWPLRQRQTLTGGPSWPLRQRQHGGHSGSWPLRQRQRGV